MAGRFVFQKLASGMSRSPISRLSAHVSFSARATAPVIARASAARSPCPCPAAAETSWSATGMPSIIMNRTTPTFVDSVTGSKRGLSSTASNKHEPSEKAKMAPQKSKVENKGVHDFTLSVVLNSLVNLMAGIGLVLLVNNN